MMMNGLKYSNQGAFGTNNMTSLNQLKLFFVMNCGKMCVTRSYILTILIAGSVALGVSTCAATAVTQLLSFVVMAD